MKKTLYIVLFTLLSITSLNSQNKKDLEFTAHLGVSFANLSSTEYGSTNSKLDYNIGVSGEYYFSNEWGIKIKFILDNKGWANGFVTDENNNSLGTDFRLTYFTIPIMVNWHFGTKKQWYLHSGIYTGILLKGKAVDIDLDISNSIRNVDLGLALGIGYRFKVSNKLEMFLEFDSQSALNKVYSQQSVENIFRNERQSFNFGIIF